MRRYVYLPCLSIIFLSLTIFPTHASECTIPNTFSAGTPAVAAEVNGNFDAVKNAVDDNDSRIATLTAALADLQATISAQADTISAQQEAIAELQALNTTLTATLAVVQSDVSAIQDADFATNISNLDTRLASVEANTVLALDGVLTLSSEDGIDTALFQGVNVQVVSGSGATNGPVNGAGNLIVGYNEDRDPNYGSFSRAGSHNIIVGDQHSYASYGSLVAGFTNAIEGPYSSVTGGRSNYAVGEWSSVSGGIANTTGGEYSSISGGFGSVANGVCASILGGWQHEADGNFTTILGYRNIVAPSDQSFGIFP